MNLVRFSLLYLTDTNIKKLLEDGWEVAKGRKREESDIILLDLHDKKFAFARSGVASNPAELNEYYQEESLEAIAQL